MFFPQVTPAADISSRLTAIIDSNIYFSCASHPPTGLTSTLTPLSLYPKRSVSLHFIDSDFWKASRPKALKRLVLEFDIDKTAHQLVPQRVELEKQRSAIDCLGLNL